MRPANTVSTLSLSQGVLINAFHEMQTGEANDPGSGGIGPGRAHRVSKGPNFISKLTSVSNSQHEIGELFLNQRGVGFRSVFCNSDGREDGRERGGESRNSPRGREVSFADFGDVRAAAFADEFRPPKSAAVRLRDS